MRVHVRYWSWFRDLVGAESEEYTLPAGASLSDLLKAVCEQHPRLGQARSSTLAAVGLDYQPPSFILEDGHEVSLFPPVQGG
jgi:molybdopterin converting factor small subunit